MENQNTMITPIKLPDSDLKYDDPHFDWSQVDEGEVTVYNNTIITYNGI